MPPRSVLNPVKTKVLLSLLAGVIVVAALIFLKGRIDSPTSPVGGASQPWATGSAPGSMPARERNRLIVGFSFHKPPYTLLGQGEAGDPYAPGARDYGIEPDLFRAAIAHTGKTFTVQAESLSRIALDVSNGAIDAAAVSMNEPRRPGVHYSKEFLAFQNVVVTHKAANLKIEKLSDMKGRSVAAWQGAAAQHGADYFENLVKDNPNYFESMDQAAQYRMFAEHHVDALVVDQYIFLWWRKQDPHPEEYVFHPVLPPNPFHIAFRDAALCDAFNEGLDQIAASGERERIFKKYLEEAPHAPPQPAANP